MVKRSYTDEQRATALALYRERGPAEASRRCGVPSATISKWAQRAGAVTETRQKVKAAVEAARLSREQKMEHLVDELLDATRETVADMSRPVKVTTITGEQLQLEKPQPKDRQALATSSGIMIDKILLLTGKANNRTETVGPDEFTSYLKGAWDAFQGQDAKP
jgi:transposase-like protein